MQQKKVNKTCNWLKTNRNYRISSVYDKMYCQKAFVHWFIRQGMEEGDMLEARKNLADLENDYLNVLLEQATDETDDD